MAFETIDGPSTISVEMRPEEVEIGVGIAQTATTLRGPSMRNHWPCAPRPTQLDNCSSSEIASRKMFAEILTDRLATFGCDRQLCPSCAHTRAHLHPQNAV